MNSSLSIRKSITLSRFFVLICILSISTIANAEYYIAEPPYPCAIRENPCMIHRPHCYHHRIHRHACRHPHRHVYHPRYRHSCRHRYVDRIACASPCQPRCDYVAQPCEIDNWVDGYWVNGYWVPGHERGYYSGADYPYHRGYGMYRERGYYSGAYYRRGYTYHDRRDYDPDLATADDDAFDYPEMQIND